MHFTTTAQILTDLPEQPLPFGQRLASILAALGRHGTRVPGAQIQLGLRAIP